MNLFQYFFLSAHERCWVRKINAVIELRIRKVLKFLFTLIFLQVFTVVHPQKPSVDVHLISLISNQSHIGRLRVLLVEVSNEFIVSHLFRIFLKWDYTFIQAKSCKISPEKISWQIKQWTFELVIFHTLFHQQNFLTFTWFQLLWT